jgi:HD-like signal output (HDOD) protein/ActR/RegA family two-component response regulator
VLRVLFVDDEAAVLQAMQRAMHSMRNDWTMEFQPSGPQALESLAKSPADVVVSDVRMPGMDGWQLLSEVKKRYPESVRLVLSGYADSAAIMRLVGVAHQYIAKPGESEKLKTAIAQTELLRSLLNDANLVRLVGSVGALPAYPRAFEDLSNCLRKPNASLVDAADIIGRDLAMTATVMKLVNSAFFGARRAISSIDRAVAYLGLDTLAALVLGHSLFQSGATMRDKAGAERLWLHSQQTAMAARAIALAEKLPRQLADEAFIAGMVHDVGKVLFAAAGGGGSAAGIGAGADERAAALEAKHAEAGAYLLCLWGFPSHIVAAVALHHAPGKRPGSGLDLTVLTHLADRLAHALAGGEAPSAEELSIEPGLLEALGLVDRVPVWAAAVGAAAQAGDP